MAKLTLLSGVIIHPEKGFYLVEKKDSDGVVRLAFPFAYSVSRDNHSRTLKRAVESTGVKYRGMNGSPFYSQTSWDQSDRKIITLGHEVYPLDLSGATGRFVTLAEINSNLEGISEASRGIVSSTEFLQLVLSRV